MQSLFPVSQAPSALPNRMTFEQKLVYCKQLAPADLLPKSYRDKPGNVLLAVEFGESLGLAPVQAIQQLHVIEGQPTCKPSLMVSLVRRAGHTFRIAVVYDEKDKAKTNPIAIAQIWRSDDPKFEYRSEWTLARAATAGLSKRDMWLKYPQAMLKARATSEVCRDACPEALCGVLYTPEELGAEVVTEDGDVVTVGRATKMKDIKPDSVTVVHAEPVKAEVVEAEPVEEAQVIEVASSKTEPTTERLALEKRAQENLRAIGCKSMNDAVNLVVLHCAYTAGEVVVDNKLNWSAIDDKGLLTLAELQPAKPAPEPDCAQEAQVSKAIDVVAQIDRELDEQNAAKQLATARRAIQMMLVAKGLGEPAKIVEYVQALGVPLELNADGLPALEKLTLEQLVQIRDGAAQ